MHHCHDVLLYLPTYWEQVALLWNCELMHRNMAIDSFYWSWNQSSASTVICAMPVKKSKTAICHNKWKRPVMLGRGLELSLKRVIFLMRNKLNILPFPFPFFFYLMGEIKFVYILMCTSAWVWDKEKEKRAKEGQN